MKKTIRKILLAIVISGLIFSVSCSPVTEPTIENGTDSIKFSEDRMMDIIGFLSAEDAGRMAGTEGERVAADYIAGRLEDYGLEVSRQDFPMTAFSCKEVSLTPVLNLELSHEVKVLSFSAPTPYSGITSEIIPVGMGADDDYKNVDVTGKIALIMRGGEFFRVKTQRAKDKGAAAVIFYDPNGEEALAATLTELSRIPAISISRMDAEVIEASVAGGKTVEAKIVVDSSVRNSTSSNVVAVYESDDNPDNNFVVVGAHYDGVDTPAANDNATGVAVLIEMAAVLAEHEIDLPFDVRFIAFGSEEIGLVGSEAYVRSMSRTDFMNIIAMINYDMVGVGEYFELLTVEETDNNGLLDAAKNVFDAMGQIPSFNYTARSDHASFSRAGIQAVDIQTSPADYYHTDEDSIDKIVPGLLTDACELGMGPLMDELPGWIE